MSNRIDNIAIPDSDSPCQSWKLYFETLVKKYGLDNAREAWLYTFNQSGNTSCTKDNEFNKWAAKNKIAVANGVDKAIAGVSNAGQNIIDGFSSMTGLAPKLATVVVISCTALGLYLVYKVVKQVQVSDVMNAIPAGRAASLAKQLK